MDLDTNHVCYTTYFEFIGTTLCESVYFLIVINYRFLAKAIHGIINPQQIGFYLRTYRDLNWPNGIRAQETRVKSQEEKARLRVQVELLLLKLFQGILL